MDIKYIKMGLKLFLSIRRFCPVFRWKNYAFVQKQFSTYFTSIQTRCFGEFTYVKFSRKMFPGEFKIFYGSLKIPVYLYSH